MRSGIVGDRVSSPVGTRHERLIEEGLIREGLLIVLDVFDGSEAERRPFGNVPASAVGTPET
jgi:hypothetical protein